MPPRAIAVKVYLNTHWMCGGDLEQVGATVARLQAQLETTTRCQVDRLHLICHRDALANAFIGAQTSTLFLAFDIEDLLREHLGAQGPL